MGQTGVTSLPPPSDVLVLLRQLRRCSGDGHFLDGLARAQATAERSCTAVWAIGASCGMDRGFLRHRRCRPSRRRGRARPRRDKARLHHGRSRACPAASPRPRARARALAGRHGRRRRWPRRLRVLRRARHHVGVGADNTLRVLGAHPSTTSWSLSCSPACLRSRS